MNLNNPFRDHLANGPLGVLHNTSYHLVNGEPEPNVRRCVSKTITAFGLGCLAGYVFSVPVLLTGTVLAVSVVATTLFDAAVYHAAGKRLITLQTANTLLWAKPILAVIVNAICLTHLGFIPDQTIPFGILTSLTTGLFDYYDLKNRDLDTHLRLYHAIGRT